MSGLSNSIIKKLSVEEKCALCAQTLGSFGKVETQSLSGIVPLDNPRGGADYFRKGRAVDGDGQYHPVAFPSNACLAMSWDKELLYQVGEKFALECRANPATTKWLFRPGMNIKRSPLNGRNFEYFSEDPVLTGELAASYVNGLQDHGVAATLKHFVCNNQEFERMTTNVVVSERALREIYVKPFEIAIEKANPYSIMSSYNKVNGEWVNENEHLKKILRDELKYDGVVVSDFAAIHQNKVKAHEVGLMDLELAPVDVHTDELIAAVHSGEITEELLDKSLTRLFDLIEKVYDTEQVSLNMETLHQEACNAAEKCIVLLQNNGILPLLNVQEKVLVVGELAENPSYMGGGSGHMNGYRIETFLDRIQNELPNVDYARGYELTEGFPPKNEIGKQDLITEAVEKARVAETVIVFAGLGYCYESEGYDRLDIQLPEGQRALLDELVKANRNIILVLSAGSVLDITKWKDELAAVVYNGLGGEGVASATVNVLFGNAEPGGRLAESWPVHENHTSAYLNFARKGWDMPDVVYGEGIYVGYRWFDKRNLPVNYSFGHGLSYTTFKIGKPILSEQNITPDKKLTITIPVTNVGNRIGSEVIQLYVGHPQKSVADHPVKELKAFEKVQLNPGETKDVVLELDKKSFQFFSPAQDKWIIEDGGYFLYIATSAADIKYEVLVLMTGGDKPYVFTEMTPLSWFLASDKYHAILEAEFPPQLCAMMYQENFDWLCLFEPLPFYKISETYLGKTIIPKEYIGYIVKRMNE